MPKIATVIVEIALNREFDYRVPPRLQNELQIGTRVVVPFGHSEARGYVTGLKETSTYANLKEIRDRVGKSSLIDNRIMELARWVGEYYAAPLEIAVRTVLPSVVRKKGSGFKERLMVFATEAGGDLLTAEALREKAPKQAAVLDALRSGGQTFLHHLARSAGASDAAVRALEKKGLVTVSREAQMRDPMKGQNILRSLPLEMMPQQTDALNAIVQSVDTLKPPVILLYGVTGSGKTEVYLQAIQHVLKQGKGAIVLVPEIALTPQTTERFRGRFGDEIAILHSNLSEGERHDEWHRVHEGKARIVIGARSALFAPVRNLGLIVVDEEHEPSYKQDETPRYNARDVAVMRGRMEKCAVVLGTATPALESYYNAKIGKYGLVKLPHRVDHRQMPMVRVVDMRIEAEREGHVNVLSRELAVAIQERLDKGEQSLLFLNRRGYSTSLICPKCGFVAECGNCSVAMTYHRQTEKLICHICGIEKKVPDRCPNPDCRDPAFKFVGVGTQRVETIVQKFFPKARVQRMDSDTTTQKNSHWKILGEFRTGKIDILIGTQMIAKGLHFPNVTLVGVIYADSNLHMPDFRAAERTFQLLTQVAGRAGRGEVKGEVIVQTYTPHHPAVQAARRLDYEGFYDQEIEFRRELSYPPFGHLVCLTIKGLSEDHVRLSGEVLAKQLEPLMPKQVILAGPSPAPLAKANNYYRYQIILRAPATSMMTNPIKNVLKTFKWPDKVSCAVDVDALSLM
ncbi:MAG TPA: primosomal protein N' [Verrucomicrobia bacterium]|nr:MAG: primosomal protein N' [Lentisphaerae bacterium GWF2_57_35]HBA85268.1 primosomal protein N' [Verrucomicrobiota bacterium]